MAEARAAAATPDVHYLEEGRDATHDFVTAWKRSFVRRLYRTRNKIRNRLWPTSPLYLTVTTLLFALFMKCGWEWTIPITSRLWYLAECLHLNEGVYEPVRLLVVSFVGGVIFFIALSYVRRWLLRCLLSYRGWMFEPLRKTSWKTLVWGVTVRCISGWFPSLYSYQRSLPCLPVPDLDETLAGFITSIEPLYGKDSEEVKKFQQQAEDFKKKLGPKLQRILVLKSWWAQNWVTDWWEKYIYLMGRTSICINSNYYILDHGYWQPTYRQVSRAAYGVYTYVVNKRKLDQETLKPLVLRGTIPLCMQQYERIFSTTRIPGLEIDELRNYKPQNIKYIVVQRKGFYYKVDVYDALGNILTPQNLEKQFEWIIQDADKHAESADNYSSATSLAALTGTERTEWAQTRTEYFSSGVNKDSIHILDSALFHVILETHSFKTNGERGQFVLHGDGRTIWFDKSFNLIFFADGKCGINVEHSWADAPVIGHISEHMYTNEVLEDLYDDDGACKPIDAVQGAIRAPERLVWEVPATLDTKIQKAIKSNQEANADLDLEIVDYQPYGKGFIKTCKVSPDAYVQCAIQLAYYKDAGKFALTYEASMTRLYLHGRTETVRSFTNESREFISAMCADNKDKAECIKLLRAACDVHQTMYRKAMAGQGLDRHMFGLYVACKGLGYESEFLKSALTIPWVLSTSQQPQQQIEHTADCSNPKFMNMGKLSTSNPNFAKMVCPGGGFGPVSDQGYGISYMIPGDLRLFFHISSKKSTPTTSSKRFQTLLEESLKEIRELFDV